MTTGIATTTANAILDSLCRSVNWTDPAAFYAKLYIGDPGATGVSNGSLSTTRKAVTFSAASGGAITNSGAVTWTGGELIAAETITYLGFWDAAAAGNFLCSDAFEIARPVTLGGTFTIAIGDIDLSIPVAA